MANVAMVGSEKGGSGKSLVALLLGGLAAEHGRKVQYVCLDSQHRIESPLSELCLGTTRLAKAAELAEDVFAQARNFSVWANALQNLADDTLLVVDIGAPQFRAAIEYAAQSRMADRLQRDGIDVTFAVPVLIETELRKAAYRALQAAGRRFPAARSPLSESRRDGLFGGPLEPEAATAEERIASEFPDIPQLTLPRVQRQAWSSARERQHCPARRPRSRSGNHRRIARLLERHRRDGARYDRGLDRADRAVVAAAPALSWRGAGGEGLGRPALPQRRAAAIAGAPCGRFCSGSGPLVRARLALGRIRHARAVRIRRGGFLLGPRPLAATLARAMAQDRGCASIDGRLAAPAAPPLRRVPTGRCPIFAIAPSTELSAAVISIRIGTALLTVAKYKAAIMSTPRSRNARR